jgi:hypothetical protein
MVGAGLFREKSTADRLLMSQANRAKVQRRRLRTPGTMISQGREGRGKLHRLSVTPTRSPPPPGFALAFVCHQSSCENIILLSSLSQAKKLQNIIIFTKKKKLQNITVGGAQPPGPATDSRWPHLGLGWGLPGSRSRKVYIF